MRNLCNVTRFFLDYDFSRNYMNNYMRIQ
ncbi:hypothetical protein Gogos_017461, partial [Gossypium gossypioides]|nr:hypothetical protein [Gossypium gossypioides]